MTQQEQTTPSSKGGHWIIAIAIIVMGGLIGVALARRNNQATGLLPSGTVSSTTSLPLSGDSTPVYYKEIPGVSLAGLSQEKQKRALDRINSDTCTCGCENSSIADCIHRDPSCETSRRLARDIIESLK